MTGRGQAALDLGLGPTCDHDGCTRVATTDVERAPECPGSHDCEFETCYPTTATEHVGFYCDPHALDAGAMQPTCMRLVPLAARVGR